MSDTLIINFQSDDEREIIVNFHNVLYCKQKYQESDYRLIFLDGSELTLSWKEHDRFTKALQRVLE